MHRHRIKKTFLIISLFFLSLFSIVNFAANETAIFAMGCFWCAQSDMDKVPGVVQTIVGYTGGTVANPSYEQVSKGETGHFESIKVIYNPKQISYASLLNYFWHHIDPTDQQGQFCDRGQQYQAVIFYINKEQKKNSEASLLGLEKTGKFLLIKTLVLPAKQFYPAETYHQNYYKKNPIRYHYYRYTCGRDQKLKSVWGK